MSGLPASERLRISEIFLSLQGESRTVGLPTVFVRLTGCPLRCNWCDTTYAFQGGERMELAAVVEQVGRFGVRHVCVTGGEPLAQAGCLPLLTQLCTAGHEVSLETSGAFDIAGVDPRVSRVVDFKAPGSGESGRNRYENVEHLTTNDQVKFVLAGRADYDWAVARIEQYRLEGRVELLFSPVHGQLPPRELAEWILADRLPVRMQLQLHKLIWGEEPGR